MDIKRRAAAEMLGSFWLVFGGCGSAVISTGSPEGVGILGISFAFGLTLLTMAFAIGRISGCHLNPAVTLGLCVAGRFPAKDAPFYVVAQVAGSIVAAALLLLIVSGTPDYDIARFGIGQNGFGEFSPGGYSLLTCVIAEIVLTAGFLLIILSVTGSPATASLAPLAIGMALTLIHIVSVPITGTSVNPARSTGPALIVGGMALQQLWVFWVAPLLGGVAGSLLYRALFIEADETPAQASVKPISEAA